MAAAAATPAPVKTTFHSWRAAADRLTAVVTLASMAEGLAASTRLDKHPVLGPFVDKAVAAHYLSHFPNSGIDLVSIVLVEEGWVAAGDVVWATSEGGSGALRRVTVTSASFGVAECDDGVPRAARTLYVPDARVSAVVKGLVGKLAG